MRLLLLRLLPGKPSLPRRLGASFLHPAPPVTARCRCCRTAWPALVDAPLPAAVGSVWPAVDALPPLVVASPRQDVHDGGENARLGLAGPQSAGARGGHQMVPPNELSLSGPCARTKGFPTATRPLGLCCSAFAHAERLQENTVEKHINTKDLMSNRGSKSARIKQ